MPKWSEHWPLIAVLGVVNLMAAPVLTALSPGMDPGLVLLLMVFITAAFVLVTLRGKEHVSPED